MNHVMHRLCAAGWSILLLIVGAGICRAAEVDLAPLATMCANNAAQGYAFKEPFVYAGPLKELVDNKGNTVLQHPTPYVYPWALEAWFPGEAPVTVSRVSASATVFPVTRWRVQLWEAGAWTTVASYIGAGGPIEATFPPTPTRGVRLLIDDARANRWGNLQLNEWHIFGPPQTPALLPATPAALSLTTQRAMNIFPFGRPIAVSAAIVNPDPARPRELSVTAEWLDYYLRPVAPAQTTAVQLAAGGRRTVPVRFQPREQGAYFCRVSLRYREALLTRSYLLCGSRDPDLLQHIQPFPARKPLGAPTPEALVGEGQLLWSTEMYHQSSHLHYLPGPAHFREVQQAGGNFICAMPTWAAVEPLPGVYNFAYYDHCLRLAEEYGIRVEFGLWNYNFGPEHKWWLEDEYARDADGKVGTGVN